MTANSSRSCCLLNGIPPAPNARSVPTLPGTGAGTSHACPPRLERQTFRSDYASIHRIQHSAGLAGRPRSNRAILGRVRPADQLLGTLLYLWNPVVVVELAAEGHNDALMIVFVLLALLLAIRARPGASLVALILGALAKFIPLILVPAQMMYVWRTRHSLPRLALQLAASLFGGVIVAVLMFRPV